MKKEIKIFLFVFFVYSFYNNPRPGTAENQYLDLLRGITVSAPFNIDAYQYNTLNKSFNNGYYYAMSAPGIAALSAPAYVFFRGFWSVLPEKFRTNRYNPFSYVKALNSEATDGNIHGFDYKEFVYSFLFLNVCIPVFLSCILFLLVYRFSKIITGNENNSSIIAMALAFGTIFFSYSTKLFPLAAGTVFGFSCFYMVFRARLEPQKPVYIILAGVFAGLTVFLNYYLSILWLCLCFYFMTIRPSVKNMVSFAAGNAVPLILLLLYNYSCFGGFFKTGYNFTGHFSYIFNRGILGSVYPSPGIFREIFLGFGRGYFLFMPVLLFSVSGFFVKWRHDFINGKTGRKFSLFYEKFICLFLFMAYLVLNTTRPDDWHGGTAFGPVYLLPTIPFMVISLVFILDKLKKGVFLGVLFFSVFLNWLGAQFGGTGSIIESIKLMLYNGISSPLRQFVPVDIGLIYAVNILFPLAALVSAVLYLERNKFKWALIFLFLLVLLQYGLVLYSMEKYYPVDSAVVVSKAARAAEIEVFEPVIAGGLRLESVLGFSTEVQNNSEVARLDIIEGNNSVSCGLFAGLDTAEWALDRPDIRSIIKHKEAKVSRWEYRQLFRKLFYRANLSYYTVKKFDKPVKAEKIRLNYTYSGKDDDLVQLQVNRILLIRK